MAIVCVMNLSPSEWIAAASAFATAAILLLQYLLERRHQKLVKLKMRHDLFDRRLAVFMKVMHLSAEIGLTEKVDDTTLFRFLRETAEGEFLFDKEIADYINEIYSKGIQLVDSLERQEALSLGEAKIQAGNKSTELRQWFSNQIEVAKEKFKRYLDISELR